MVYGNQTNRSIQLINQVKPWLLNQTVVSVITWTKPGEHQIRIWSHAQKLTLNMIFHDIKIHTSKLKFVLGSTPAAVQTRWISVGKAEEWVKPMKEAFLEVNQDFIDHLKVKSWLYKSEPMWFYCMAHELQSKEVKKI